LWDVTRHRQVGAPLITQFGDITALAFSPNGTVLASGSTGAAVQFWTVVTHRSPGGPLLGHLNTVLSLIHRGGVSKAVASRGTSCGCPGAGHQGHPSSRGYPVPLQPMVDVRQAVLAFSPDGT